MDEIELRMQLTSADVVAERVERLKQLIPEAFSEGKLDIELLKNSLGDGVGEGKERYGLTWAGKAEAIRAIQAPGIGTLLPILEESVNFDETENLLIEGDNLEVLKLLQKSYYSKVKLIYIDPPYNRDKDFIYPDRFSEGLQEYLKFSGQVDDQGKQLTTNVETSGRYHSKWLDMMFPRLFLGRNLLTEDGFIVVSIDDKELANLRLLMNEVFGEENAIATLVFDRNRKNDANLFSVGHEYMLVYARNQAFLKSLNLVLRAPKEGVDEIRDLFDTLRKKHNDDWELVASEIREFYETFEEDDPRTPLARYTNVDEQGPYRTDGDPSWPGGGGPDYEVLHPLTGLPCKVPSRGWVWPTRERMQEEIDKGLIVFGANEKTIPSVRRNLFDKDEQVMRSVIFSYAQKASQDFAKVFDGLNVFDNPKSFLDLRKIVEYLTAPGDLVVDFFAGSGTTAHAVILANCETKLQRRFICVQLPQPIVGNDGPSVAARSLGYRTIADLCRDRIRRVIKGLDKDDAGRLHFQGKVARGFRSFRLSASCFRTWGQQKAKSASELAEQLNLFADHMLPGRSELDVVFEVLLKSGLPLNSKVVRKQLDADAIYSVLEGLMIVCLSESITDTCLREIIALGPERVICLDRAFQGNDQLKTNAVLEMKSHHIDFRTV